MIGDSEQPQGRNRGYSEISQHQETKICQHGKIEAIQLLFGSGISGTCGPGHRGIDKLLDLIDIGALSYSGSLFID